jgi:hypothetical protein
MPEQLPNNFSSDDELAEWFENADLSRYLLEVAEDVVVASHVTLTIEEDTSGTPGTAGEVADNRFELVGPRG